MADDTDSKAAYNYRLLAALDSSIAAGKDFVVGRGWAPLVNVGGTLISVLLMQRGRVLSR
jgi:hypothetical protein